MTQPNNTRYGPQLVTSREAHFSTQFYDFNTVGDWEVIHQVAGMTVDTNPKGGAVANTSPYIEVAMGTTANAKVVLLARPIFSAPLEARFAITMSQRIANQQVMGGFFEVDPLTGAILTDSKFTTVNDLLNARNAVAISLKNTTVANMDLIYRSAGSGQFSTGDAGYNGFTTAAGGTTPNFTFADEIVLNFERDRITLRTLDNNSPLGAFSSTTRSDNVPNPTKFYRFGFVCHNFSSAPATATTARFHLLNIEESVEVDISPRVQSIDTQRSLPVVASGLYPTGSTVVGNPLPVAVEGRTSNPTAVSGGSFVRPMATAIGAQVVQPYAIPEAVWATTLALTTTTAAAIRAAQAAGIKSHLVWFQATNTGASAVDVIILDNTTERLRVTVPAGQSVDFTLPIPVLVTAATALNVNLSAAGTVRFNAIGYTAP